MFASGSNPLPLSDEHFVQLYSADAELVDVVVNYSLDVLQYERQAILFFATRRHCELFKRGLLLQEFDVGGAIAAGRLTFLPVDDLLPLFFRDGVIDAPEFLRLASSHLREARRGGRFQHLHVFGEIVNALWREGHERATLQLERLWNQLGRTEAFTLYCAFQVERHVGELLNGSMRDVLCTHDSLLTERAEDGVHRRRSFIDVPSLARAAADLPLVTTRTGPGRSVA